MPILFSVYIFGITLLLIPYGLALSLFSPIIMYRFAERESISDALDVAAVMREFRGNWQNALVVALITMGIQSIAGIGLFLLLVGIFFTIFYSYVVSAYLCGVLYLSTRTTGAMCCETTHLPMDHRRCIPVGVRLQG